MLSAAHLSARSAAGVGACTRCSAQRLRAQSVTPSRLAQSRLSLALPQAGKRCIVSARRPISKELDDTWASSPIVRGHVYSRPSFEPYEFAPVHAIGSGTDEPPDWSKRLLTAAGMKSNGSPNQDAFSYTLLDSGWIVCVASDGHGEQGEAVSARIVRMLPRILSQHVDSMGLQQALPRAFAETQKDLESSLPRAQVYSGATVATCCVHHAHKETWFAHAGDSRAVLGDLANGSVAFCTEEHKAHDPKEHKRLQDAGAQVIQKTYDDGAVVSRVFVPRTGFPGLAMSRSLGDGCLKNYGVTAEPEVHNISGLWEVCEAPVILMASDGLWDTISIEDTMRLLAARCQKGQDVVRGIEALCRRAQRIWIEDSGDYCDDVTIMFLAPKGSTAVSRPASA